MTGPARVVVVDPYSSGVLLAPALRRAGFEAAGVLSWPEPAKIYTASLRRQDFPRLLEERDGRAALTARLAHLRPAAVVAGAESGVELADALAVALIPERANGPDRAPARRHKGAMVAAVAAEGLRTPRSICTASPAAARAWLAEQGLGDAEIVVKPAKSAATNGVTLARGEQAAVTAMAALLGEVNLFGHTNDEVVMQERVRGVEHVVDTFTVDGTHSITNICRYTKTATRRGDFVYESMEFLEPTGPTQDALVAFVRRVLDALHVRWGFAHTEVMMTVDGPCLVEVGARLAGAGLPSACTLATGSNGVDRLTAALRGEPLAEDRYALRRHVLVGYFVAGSGGVATGVARYQEIARLRSCRSLHVGVREGDRVEATANLLDTMALGWALFAHPSREVVLADYHRMREIESRVRFVA